MRLAAASLLFVCAESFNGPGRPIVHEEVDDKTEKPVVVTESPSEPSAVEVATTTEAPETYHMTVAHDFNTKRECWDGLAVKSTVCWAGANGVFYRYGCKEGETKIYTDICESDSCEPASCLGEWTWHEETSHTCYNDGSSFYQFECTDQEQGSSYSPAGKGGRIEGSSTKTCQQLDWDPMEGKSPFVCSQSKINKECGVDSDYDTAEAFCTSVGARLCTADELEEDEAKGSGCKGDCEATWSSTPCNGGHYILAGASKCADQHEKRCSSKNDAARPRCCADVVNTNVGVSSGLPAGYQLATSHDYAAADLRCGGNPTRSYSCWVNPLSGMAQRFACSADSDNIWFQSCGMDTTCSSENCSGEWQDQKEMVGRCYSAPNGDLYSYEC